MTYISHTMQDVYSEDYLFEYSVSNYRAYNRIFPQALYKFCIIYHFVCVCTIILPVVLRGKEVPDIEGKV